MEPVCLKHEHNILMMWKTEFGIFYNLQQKKKQQQKKNIIKNCMFSFKLRAAF